MTKQKASDVIMRLRRTIEAKINDGSLDNIHEGLQVKLGNASYTGDSIFPITFKIEVSATNDDGTIETKEVKDFKTNAIHYGLSPDDLGKEFTQNDHTFKISGLNGKRRKYPISVTRNDGKKFKFTAEQIKQLLQRAA